MDPLRFLVASDDPEVFGDRVDRILPAVGRSEQIPDRLDVFAEVRCRNPRRGLWPTENRERCNDGYHSDEGGVDGHDVEWPNRQHFKAFEVLLRSSLANRRLLISRKEADSALRKGLDQPIRQSTIPTIEQA